MDLLVCNTYSMIFEKYETLNTQGVIASKVNPFEGETMLYSYHRGRDSSLYGCRCIDIAGMKPNVSLPIDIMFKSNQAEEQFYIVLTVGKFIWLGSGKLILNLNGNTNVVLETNYSTNIDSNELFDAFPKTIQMEDNVDDFLYELYQYIGDDYQLTHYYFPISKDDFLKCCQTSTLAIQVKVDEHKVWRVWSDTEELSVSKTLLPIFRTLYNKAIDNTMFKDAERESLELYKEPVLKKKGLFGLFK